MNWWAERWHAVLQNLSISLYGSFFDSFKVECALILYQIGSDYYSSFAQECSAVLSGFFCKMT